MTRSTNDSSHADAAMSSCTDVLTRLSHLDPSTLAQILLQHGQAIGTAVRLTLTNLAHAELCRSSISSPPASNDSGLEEEEVGAARMLGALAVVLSRALGRGDPSLARTLLPGTPSLIDLAVSIGTLHQTSQKGIAAKLRAALRSLIDPHLAAEILQAVHVSLQSAVLQPFQTQQQRSDGAVVLVEIQRRTRLLALLLRALPVVPASSRSDEPYTAALRELARDLGTLHDVILPALSFSATGALAGAAHEAAQTHVRDAALALVLLCPPTSGHSAVADLVAHLGSAAAASAKSGHSTNIVDVLRARFLTNSEVAWDELMVALKKNASSSSVSDLATPEDLILALQQRTKKRSHVAPSGAKGKQRAMTTTRGSAPAVSVSIPVDPEILATVRSVLPHLDTPSLARRLQRPKYAAAKTAEQVIDLLLESNSDVEVDEEQEMEDGEEEEGDAPDLQPYEPPASIVRTRRANIFDDDPLDVSKFRYKADIPSLDTSTSTTATAGRGLHSIPSDLKASVLARVAAQEREEEEEEWDLDGGRIREAGFEEELEPVAQEDDEAYTARNGGGMDWVGRRGMTTSLAQTGGGSGRSTAAVPSAREWRRKIEDESEEEDADVNSAGGPSTAGAVPPASGRNTTATETSTSSASSAGERAAERVLTQYYSQHGAGLFARDPALRKGNHALAGVRRRLFADLERESGKVWDHGLVESWGTMFERNPRKDKLLARSTDLLGPNPNRPRPAPVTAGGQDDGDGEDADGARRFGPDRGRGGRVLRGGGGSRGRGGAGGGSGDASSGGPPPSNSGSGSGAGRGQHSGSNRGARQKEKRGSSARFRGGRGGGMARSGAFPAGVGE
ncbi:unnamed protein product [Tilletia laevis]|uniref:CUE domain-containing protein n=2 Tax=Tilletia TaxID=13289 RepID=A0A177VE52_9BASI|nr:hypothetical protein CF336_g5419 [Tilletia laevis]KAE8261329.1 hypothetical protein A4X03_0g3352 [Tilletia caries]CAD6927575.1 unnamed protein product [Tilletia controversa]KAE8197216.1 hypothetical protein CF335_g4673 [Tilletia laevis]CAD6884049.1 unnamed protein product [Tilletia caries]